MLEMFSAEILTVHFNEKNIASSYQVHTLFNLYINSRCNHTLTLFFR